MTSQDFREAFYSHRQHSLALPIRCEGVGLHSGKAVVMTMHPAPANSGIIFARSDMPDSLPIPASAMLVSETRLGTSLKASDGSSVATVEHLMAALWGMGVDNAHITLDGPEVPIMDGSSEPFIEMIQQVGLKQQSYSRRVMEIVETVSVEIGESKIEIRPYNGFCLDIEIDYAHPQIRKQEARYDFAECHFMEALAEARTFGFAQEVEQLKAIGLARGGSLQNAVVLDESGILNREGLRSNDEFVRHKALDCVGDLFLTGYRIRGNVKAIKPGHQINTAMAQALLQQPTKWRIAEQEAPQYLTAGVLRKVAAPQAQVFA